MNKKVGVVGTYGRVNKCSFMSTDTLLNKVGQNTGNLLFQYAVCNLIGEEIAVIGEDLPWNVDIVREQCRVIAVPSANFIRENFDFSGFVNFLEATQLPLVFLGLGAQAKDYDQTEFNFHPSIHKLFSLLKERCQLTGLRGEFTQNLLEKFGVTNTVITGCPTNFLNSDPDLPKKLEKKWNRDICSFLATGDEPWPKDQRKRDAERKMINWVSNGNGILIQQSVAPFVKYARQNNPYQIEDVPEHHEESLRKAIAPNMTNDEFRVFVATKMRIYYSVDQWLEDSARFDFSIGMRLHGNMAAWQAGTPAIWVYHDSRTRELCETMALPHLSIDNFLLAENINLLKSSIEFNWDNYSKRKSLLRKNFVAVFSRNEIKNSL